MTGLQCFGKADYVRAHDLQYKDVANNKLSWKANKQPIKSDNLPGCAHNMRIHTLNRGTVVPLLSTPHMCHLNPQLPITEKGDLHGTLNVLPESYTNQPSELVA